MLSWLVHIKFIWTLAQRNTSVFALTFRQEQRPLGTKVPKGVEWKFHRHSVGMFWVPGHCGVRGNEFCRWARKRGYFSPVFLYRNLPWGGGIFGCITRRKIKSWMWPSIWRYGWVLAVLRFRLGNWSRAPVLQLITGYCPLAGYSLRLVCNRSHYWT